MSETPQSSQVEGRPMVSPVPYALTAIAVIGILFAVALLENYFGVDIRGKPLADNAVPLPFSVPIAIVPCAGVIAYYLFRRNASIVRQGVLVHGFVTGIGMAAMLGQRIVWFRYDVNGMRRRKRKSFADAEIAGLAVGDRIQLIVHPYRPDRYYVVSARPIRD